MRMISTKRSRIAAVDKYLFPGETRMIVVRQHPAVLIQPVVRVLGGLLVAWVTSDTLLHSNKWLVVLVWVLWGFLFLQLLDSVVKWAEDRFVVTSERLLSISGTFPRKVCTVPLTKVTDVGFKRSGGGLLLGYGTLNIESSSPHRALQTVDYLPYPEQIYTDILELIFSNTDDRHRFSGNVGRLPD